MVSSTFVLIIDRLVHIFLLGDWIIKGKNVSGLPPAPRVSLYEKLKNKFGEILVVVDEKNSTKNCSICGQVLEILTHRQLKHNVIPISKNCISHLHIFFYFLIYFLPIISFVKYAGNPAILRITVVPNASNSTKRMRVSTD